MGKRIFGPPPISPGERVKEIMKSPASLVRNLIYEAPVYNKKKLIDLSVLHYLYERITDLEEEIEKLRSEHK